MKLIYTNENRFLVSNMKNIVENAGIEVTLKNEFAFGGVGDLSPFECWLELWVVDEKMYDHAKQIITEALQTVSSDWTCRQCTEENPSSFDICWHCESEKSREV